MKAPTLHQYPSTPTATSSTTRNLLDTHKAPDDPISALYELGLIPKSDNNNKKINAPPRKSGKSHHHHHQVESSSSSAPRIIVDPNSNKTVRLPRGHSNQKSASGLRLDYTSDPYEGVLRQKSAGSMTGMLDNDRSRTRRERTFVGSECAVCEEPLEHTLRGERILQFSCSHVSHEACFYEYIKEFESQYCPTCNAPLGLDTSRGGNVLDLEKLSNLVRSVSIRSTDTLTPSQWDSVTRPTSRGSNSRTVQSRDSNRRNTSISGSRESRDSRERLERYGALSRNGHQRNDSEMTGVRSHSSSGYAETTQSGVLRRHDYDVQAMEAKLTSPRPNASRNPIPAPVISVRSELPTINRSRQQQTLTCLVTVEVPESNWTPDPDDLRIVSGILPMREEEKFERPPSPAQSARRFHPYESREVLNRVTENLYERVENWHGLDFSKFGKLRLYGTVKVGKDKKSWQELECYLFSEMLICVKEKRTHGQVASLPPQFDEVGALRKTTRCTLKGSILIKKHLNKVIESREENILTLNLSVAELPLFHLRFDSRNQLKLWQQGLLDLNAIEGSPIRRPEYDREEEDEWQRLTSKRVSSSNASSYGAGRSVTTALTDYTGRTKFGMPASFHVPMDIVVVVPISSSMQGVKISLVRDALNFMVQNLGERDRMGLVTFGSGGGGVPIVGMTTKTWSGWSGVLSSIRPVGAKNHRSDVVEGANVAMDLLMQRKSNNPIATILLISDSSTSDAESVDFVVSRAEAAKIAIHSFGLGMTHKPDMMIELSTRTKGSYTYVKDWMMLRECLGGCLGSLQSLSHQNVKLKLRLPEGSPAKFVKISGALQITRRATGRDAEASLGDLRFGDKRDVLVQLVIPPDNASPEALPQDPWEFIVSGLEALGGSIDSEDQRTFSVEELPLIQADLQWGDILRDGNLTHMPRPSLLAITMLPPVSQNKKSQWTISSPIPPHPSIVQRRMELLTSDMLTRALTLVSRGQHDRAQHLLNETRSILKGLGKGGLPPIPPPQSRSPNPSSSSSAASPSSVTEPTSNVNGDANGNVNGHRRTPSPPEPKSTPQTPNDPSPGAHARSADALSPGTAPGIDGATVAALDSELESSLEWINHPAQFGRDSRKAILQAIGVISSQRGHTFRTPMESLWAGRVGGVRRLAEASRAWRDDVGDIREES